MSSNDWYKCKPYSHFDTPLTLEDATRLVKSPNLVAKHAFYPLIRYSLKHRRLRVTEGQKPERDLKLRDISYPAHKDGYIFSYYKYLLNQPYEEWVSSNCLSEAVTAFRKTSKNNIKLARDAFETIKNMPECAILATDIEKYFDRIDHNLLKQKWCQFLGEAHLPDDHYAVFKAVTNFSYVHRHKVYNTLRIPHKSNKWQLDRAARLCEPHVFRQKIAAKGLIRRNDGLAHSRGIPQGLPISPLLSNMYLCDVDLRMYSIVSGFGGSYWRYCDDILIVAPSAEILRHLRSELVTSLNAMKVQLHPDKTAHIKCSDLLANHPIEYLGFSFDGVVSTIRPSSIQRFRSRVKKCLEEAYDVRHREAATRRGSAPLRVQKLYNLYGDGAVKGVKARNIRQRRKFGGSFVSYVRQSARVLKSDAIRRQRHRALKYVSAMARGGLN